MMSYVSKKKIVHAWSTFHLHTSSGATNQDTRTYLLYRLKIYITLKFYDKKITKKIIMNKE